MKKLWFGSMGALIQKNTNNWTRKDMKIQERLFECRIILSNVRQAVIFTLVLINYPLPLGRFPITCHKREIRVSIARGAENDGNPLGPRGTHSHSARARKSQINGFLPQKILKDTPKVKKNVKMAVHGEMENKIEIDKQMCRNWRSANPKIGKLPW